MIMNKKIIFLIVLAEVILFSGCIGQKQTEVSDKEKAELACTEECNNNLEKGTDLNSGPCLMNPMSNLPDWICDVAHEPRQDVDDDQKNQCSAFSEGKAHHFVEVDINCNLIKTW